MCECERLRYVISTGGNTGPPPLELQTTTSFPVLMGSELALIFVGQGSASLHPSPLN